MHNCMYLFKKLSIKHARKWIVNNFFLNAFTFEHTLIQLYYFVMNKIRYYKQISKDIPYIIATEKNIFNIYLFKTGNFLIKWNLPWDKRKDIFMFLIINNFYFRFECFTNINGFIHFLNYTIKMLESARRN